MPIYEYRCDCGFEKQQFSHTFNPESPSCEACQARMGRKVSLPAGLLAGRGISSLPPVPKSWNGLKGGDKGVTKHWRKELDRRSKEFGSEAPPTRGTPSRTCSGHSETGHVH
jgi:putative FmdB family regulatory protein